MIKFIINIYIIIIMIFHILTFGLFYNIYKYINKNIKLWQEKK